MRLPNSAHTSRFWRIHEITQDFRLEDVWALPTPGGPDAFPLLVQAIASADPSRGSSGAARALWSIRWTLGRLLGWDRPDAGLDSRVPTLRDRLPADLRSAPGPDFAALPFRSLYLLDDEFAAEIANRTMHGVMHLGWVPDGTGGFRGQMAVLVKPKGLFGTLYMAAIRPFRHLIVYPAAIRQIERQWRAGAGRRRAAQVGTTSPHLPMAWPPAADVAQPLLRVFAPPPFLFAAALVVGLIVQAVVPWRILTHRAIGVVVGGVFSAVGLALSVTVVRSFHRAGTPVSPRRPTSHLVVAGPYRFSRNPDYLGQALVSAGLALVLNALWVLLAVLPVLLLVRYGVIAREERYLENLFEEDYRRYRQHVRRWF